LRFCITGIGAFNKLNIIGIKGEANVVFDRIETDHGLVIGLIIGGALYAAVGKAASYGALAAFG